MERDRTADAIRETLISPNEADQNLEPANVVDSLFAIARVIHGHGKAIDRLAQAIENRSGFNWQKGQAE